MAWLPPSPALLVAVGGGLGAWARWAVTPWLSRPWGTLSVNVVGCLLIGAVAGARLPGAWTTFLAVGVLGGFTTFSAFGLDALELSDEGRPALAWGYALASVGLGLLGVLLGRTLTRTLLG